MSDHIKTLPVLALRGINIFPGTIMHFDVKRQKSITALDEAMKDGQIIFLLAQKQAHIESPNTDEDLYLDGTITKIKQLIKLPNKTHDVNIDFFNDHKPEINYKEIYQKNCKNEELTNWYYEKYLLGYSYSTSLKKIYSTKKLLVCRQAVMV